MNMQQTELVQRIDSLLAVVETKTGDSPLIEGFCQTLQQAREVASTNPLLAEHLLSLVEGTPRLV